MENNTPFYPQKWTLSDWTKMGFKNEAEAEYWQDNSCGVLCLKMIADAKLNKEGKKISPPIAYYIKKGVEQGAYIDPIGWSHQGIASLARHFGLIGEAKTLTPEEIKKELIKGSLIIISIKWAFQNHKNWKERILFWKKFGGHLALVIGFKEIDGQLTGFYVHHTSIIQEYNWPNKFIPLAKFENGFTGRGIIIKNVF